ncbi:hypothetical protein [uncultured Helicobacter sp.]|uniref:hypothetical protein n=1 Tax=uncultured Helicobacter sp. TaxID=175537 RepID=UPI00374EA33D
MQYFVTIYIDTMKPKLDFMPFTIPHAFLGLTHTHPDELDNKAKIYGVPDRCLAMLFEILILIR